MKLKLGESCTMEGVGTKERLPSSVGGGETVTSGNMSVDVLVSSPPPTPSNVLAVTLFGLRYKEGKKGVWLDFYFDSPSPCGSSHSKGHHLFC